MTVEGTRVLDSADARELADLLRRQQQLLETLIELLDRRLAPEQASEPAAAAEAPPPPPGPVDWVALSGPERRRTLHELATFVESTVLHYKMPLAILPCWWRHPEVIEELTALWQVRKETFRPGVKPSATMQWHDALYKVRDRVSVFLSSCREGHIAPVYGAWMSDAERAELAAFIARQG
ncbi:hypothetical protein ABZ801_01880 [Actinomadura sp. NPDC047616]|uniref:hypothetical protein n=1 Tax=Actinomadura sp. NPDC047616 TaxID=3155914 RepID=UPI0033CA9163